MNADDLASALIIHGFNATSEDAADGVETVRVLRPEDGSTTNEIDIENGIPFWPWGSPVSGG